MIVNRIVYLTLGLSFGFATQMLAQRGIVVSGGVAAGAGGTVTYSIGQVDYINVAENGHAITQGLQQPFELLILKGEDPGIIVDTGPVLSIYPNPAKDFVVVKVENPGEAVLSYGLYDVLGRLIKKEKLSGIRTTISLTGLAGSNYVVTIFNDKGNKVLKTFKIIKI